MQLKADVVLTGNGLTTAHVAAKRNRLNSARPRGTTFSTAIDPDTFDFLMAALIDQYADLIENRAHANDINNKNFMTHSQLLIDTYNLGCILRVAPLLNRSWRDAAFSDVRWRWLVYFHLHLPQTYVLIGDHDAGAGICIQQRSTAVSVADRDRFRSNDRTPASIPALHWDENTRVALAVFADCDPSFETMREIPGLEALRPTERRMLPCAYKSHAESTASGGAHDPYPHPLVQQSSTALSDSIYAAMSMLHSSDEDYNAYWGLRLTVGNAAESAYAVKRLKLDSIGMPANLPSPLKAWVVRKLMVRERLFREKCVETWMSGIHGSIYGSPEAPNGEQLPFGWDVHNATWGAISDLVISTCWPNMTLVPCTNKACSRKCRANNARACDGLDNATLTAAVDHGVGGYHHFEHETDFDHWIENVRQGSLGSSGVRAVGVHEILQLSHRQACYDRRFRAHVKPAHNLLLATQPSDRQSLACEHPHFHPHGIATLVHSHVVPFSPLFGGSMFNSYSQNLPAQHSYLRKIGLRESPKTIHLTHAHGEHTPCSLACAKVVFDELARHSLFAMVPSQELLSKLKALQGQFEDTIYGVPSPAQILTATWAIHNELVRQHGVEALTVRAPSTCFVGDDRTGHLPALKHGDGNALSLLRTDEIDAFNVHLGMVVAAAVAEEMVREGKSVGTVPGLRRMTWAVYSTTPSLSDNAVRKVSAIYLKHGCPDDQDRTLCAVPAIQRSVPHWIKKVMRHTKAGDIFKN